MYLSYDLVTATATVKTASDITIPANATMAELQADTQDIRYIMNNVTNPTQSRGMILLTTEPPKSFLIEDLKRIRFIRGTGTNGNLNVHFFAGRDV